MIRTLAILVLTGVLLVSAGGNVVLYRQSTDRTNEIARLQARIRDSDSERAALTDQVAKLTAQVSAAASAPQSSSSQSQQAPSRNPGLSPAPSPQPAAGGPNSTLLSAIETQVAQIRGLPKKSDVPLKFLDHDALKQYFLDSFEKDYLPRERESDQKLLATLGMLGPNENLVQILLDLLQEQVVGTYNEDEKVMYLVGDQSQFGPDEKVSFAHEFVHALQDQYYDLPKLAPKHPTNADRSLAIHAIVEGDAVLAQRLWAQDNLTPQEIQQLGQGGDTTRLEQAPLLVRTELLFPYSDGFRFVLQAYQLAGGYKGVDDVFKNPPESTEQILHPEKYRAQEHPVEVSVPDLAQSLGEGWRKVDSNVLGELDLRTVIEQYGDRAAAGKAAAGWGGDRWQLLEKDGKRALAYHTVWDTEDDAREFFDAFGKALRSRFRGAKEDVATDTRLALTTPNGASELRRTGRDTLVVISFDRPSADAITAAVGGF